MSQKNDSGIACFLCFMVIIFFGFFSYFQFSYFSLSIIIVFVFIFMIVATIAASQRSRLKRKKSESYYYRQNYNHSNPYVANNTANINNNPTPVKKVDSSFNMRQQSKYCRECGVPIIEGTSFCQNCGMRLNSSDLNYSNQIAPIQEKEETNYSIDKLFCPFCGIRRDIDAVYCFHCGTKLV